MKVADVMSTHVDVVSTTTKVDDVCRLIFGRGINGVPVCKGRKLVGFITERDILSKFYPSMDEYMEDPVHSADFEAMEEKVAEIFSLDASKIMSRNPTTVTADTPLLRAQSLMFVHKVGRLPVVDGRKHLIGIISKGDIFRAVVGGRIPYVGDEEYHDWLARHYDLVVKWETRLGHEIPDLAALFHREGVKKVLDIGAGTGAHSIALAEKGFEVVGLERSLLMHQASKEKWEKLPAGLQKRVSFVKGEYEEVLKQLPNTFGAAIFMGNALPHNPHNYREVLGAVSKSLLPKRAVIVLQIVNFERVFKKAKRLQDFNIVKARLGQDQEHAFVEFYDLSRERGGTFTLNMAILDFDGRRWRPFAFNSTPIADLHRENVRSLLQKLGFRKVSFYGGILLGPLFKHSFKPLESDYLIVVAKR